MNPITMQLVADKYIRLALEEDIHSEDVSTNAVMPEYKKDLLTLLAATECAAEEMQIPENKARDLIQKNDKQRSSYYNYYTSKKWGDSRGYHLTLDSSQLGIEGCVDMILDYRKHMTW